MSPVPLRGGLLLGNGASGPMSLALFRPRSTRVVAIGPLELARVLAFRAMALGAGVTVRSESPADWAVLRAMAPDPEALRLVGRFTELAVAGLPYRPALMVDQVHGGPVTPLPWQALLEWRERPEVTVADLRLADAAVVVDPDAATWSLLARAHGLDAGQVARARDADTSLVVSWPRGVEAVDVQLTPQEREVVGVNGSHPAR